MAKAELKTKPNAITIEKFLKGIKDPQQREDSLVIIEMMKHATGDEPVMWGSAIVGFGNTHLRYASGRELDWFKIGFSPRKQNLTLYALCGTKRQQDLLKKLGKHKTGKGCLYINKLSDVNMDVLRELVEGAGGQFSK